MQAQSGLVSANQESMSILRISRLRTYKIDLRVTLDDEFVVVLDVGELLLGHVNLSVRNEVDLALLDHLVVFIHLLGESRGLDLALHCEPFPNTMRTSPLKSHFSCHTIW